jgi:hypothetical protein
VPIKPINAIKGNLVFFKRVTGEIIASAFNSSTQREIKMEIIPNIITPLAFAFFISPPF